MCVCVCVCICVCVCVSCAVLVDLEEEGQRRTADENVENVSVWANIIQFVWSDEGCESLGRTTRVSEPYLLQSHGGALG